MSFSGLFARMQYFHGEHDSPKHLVTDLNTLRILANQAVHDEGTQLNYEQVLSGAKSIYDFIKHLDNSFVDELLEERIKQAKGFQPLRQSEKSSFVCMIKEYRYHINAGKKAGIEIKGVDEDNRDVNILLRNDLKNKDKTPYTDLLPSLWKYATLACINLTPVKGRQGYFMDRPESIVVLEPDFLVDASAIGECYNKDETLPELFAFNRLFSNPSSDKMLQGTMVNIIFDELMQGADDDFLQLFKEGLKSIPIPMVALGTSAAMDIYNGISGQHYLTLKNICEGIAKDDFLLEPSFMCPSYGLKGRLDLLYKDKGKVNIVELKSGKPHPHQVWPAHRAQMVAYNMIIRNAFGEKDMGYSSIFYSASDDNPLRHVPNISTVEHNIILLRNRIVGLLYLLMNDPKSFFDWVKILLPDRYESFNQDKLKRLQNMLKSIEDYEYEWYSEQVKRVVRELWQVKIGSGSAEGSLGYNALWRSSLQEKEGKIISHLKIAKLGPEGISLRYTQEPPVTDFRVGDIVILYDMGRAVDRQEVIRGTIEELKNDEIVFKARGGLSRKFKQDSLWALEHDVLESYLFSPLASLGDFLESPKETRSLFLGLREPTALPIEESEDEKETILRRMKAAKELYLVQGPPGTGKTSGIIGSYLEELYQNSSKVIMVLSFTNRAVDEICACLQERKIPFIRTGISRQIKEEILSQKIEGKRYQEIEEIIRENRIFISSVQSATGWYTELFRIREIDEILVDEASQVLESNLLGMVSKVPKSIFIGDQNQLPAITVQSPMRYSFKHELLQGLCYEETNQSLMERLYKVFDKKGWGRHHQMLSGHYRMHDEIAALILHFYDGKLKVMREEQKAELMPKELPYPFANRLIWIDLPPSEYEYHDPLMTDVIERLIKRLKELKIVEDENKDLGIVAPYRKMIHSLKQRLGELSVDTVERYQGSERACMILAFPLRSRAGIFGLQSLSADSKVDRKLNVAISRAKERLIILANSKICLDSVHYGQLFRHIKANGAVISIDEIDF